VKNSYRRFALVNLIGLVLSGWLVTWISRSGTLDFWIERQFFDPLTHRFPLKNAHQLVFLGHTLLKNVTAVGLIVALALALASSWGAYLKPWRRALATFCLMATGSALLVQGIKDHSVHACPWDLAMYGGRDAWYPLFDRMHAVVEMGRCWPGGHASGGFAIIAGYFALRTQRPQWARAALVLGLALGTVMGGVQMVRGAHFLSHNLWTLWFVWAMCFTMDGLIQVVSRCWPRRRGIAAALDSMRAAVRADELTDAAM
jgi:membrane-associated PAP2 superfamily phosphatase